MGQYLQFRSWAARSSGSEKALAATALGVVVALTGLSLVPTGGDGDATSALAAGAAGGTTGGPGGTGALGGATGGSGSTGAGTGGGTTGSTTSSSTGASTGGSTTGGTTGGTTGATGATTGPGGSSVKSGSCAPGAREVGVTDTTITVAHVLLNLGGAVGNTAVGVATPEEQQKMAEAAVAEVNATGGAACRKLVVKYFTGNPIDSSSARQICLQIVEAKVYAVVDASGDSYPAGAPDCIAQNKIPLVAAGAPTPSEFKRLFPYYMSVLDSDPTQSFRNMVFAMQRRGYFDPAKGFKKLGLFMDECSPEVNKLLLADLARIGQTKDKISLFTFSCPSSGFASPSETNAAVVKHRQDGVTHVIPVTGSGSFKGYSSFAQQQGYKPVYTASDYTGFPITATGATGPDRDNFDGTVAITSYKIGMTTSGFTDAPTEACKALMKRRGIDPNWVTDGHGAGVACEEYRIFAEAATKAPRLTRVDLHLGVAALGKRQISFLGGNASYSATDLIGGDDYWPIQYRKSCNCWKVLDRNRRPSEH